MINNPVACGYDLTFMEYKMKQDSNGKVKKVIINSSGVNNGQIQLKAVPTDENQAPLIGKIGFVKDVDIEHNEFEQNMCQWIINFHRKLSKYCIRKPRYSELRPMKFSLS